jgi:hypothetical protein
MAVDVATLGLKVESGPVVKATESLDRLSHSAGRAERSANEFNRGAASASQSTRQLARDLDDATRGANSFGAAFVRGLGRGVITAAVAGAGAAVLAITKEVAGLGDTARKTGLDLQRLQEIRISGQMQGIAAPKIDMGLDAMSKKLNEARQTENDLTRFLDENNIKYKTRTGEIISTNQALEAAANLISRAATEQDKIRIAEAFGLPSEFVPMLEKGVAGLEAAGRAARESGGIIDADLVARAADFDRAWTSAVAQWSATAKANILSVAAVLADLVAQAQNFMNVLGNASVFGRINKALGVKPEDVAAFEKWGGIDGKQGVAPKPAGNQFDPSRFNMEVGAGRALTYDQKLAAARQLGLSGNDVIGPTKTKSLFGGGGGGGSGGGGGGGGGMSAAEQAQQRLERYTESLKRQGDVLDAEIATFGRSNAERKAAIEIARAQTDLQKLDAASRQQLVNAITAEVTANEQKRQQLEQLAGTQAAARQSAQTFTDAISDFALEGERAGDVFKKLGKSLARDLINATFAGSGPYASIFGTKDGGGIFGSIFKGIGGSLFSGATGSTGTGGLYAKGGAFANDNVVPFAKGGSFTNSIVNRPTTFRFAKGVGLMGEAGPEAIMPLKRGPNGALGVALNGGMAGGSSSVVVEGTTVNIQGNADQAAIAQLKRDLAERDKALGTRVQAILRQSQVRGMRP